MNTDTGKSYSFDEVSTLKYLRVTVTRNLETQEQIQARAIKGNRCVYGLRGLKVKIYQET